MATLVCCSPSRLVLAGENNQFIKTCVGGKMGVYFKRAYKNEVADANKASTGTMSPSLALPC